MRIISQKGIEPMLDLPYEQVELTVRGKLICAIVPSGADMLIANYSTPQKADEAMAKLQGKYTKYVGTLFQTHGYPCAPIFRFPDDSEV